MMELNPDHPVTQAMHNGYHIILSIILHKYKFAEIHITEEDIHAYQKDHPDSALMVRDGKDGIHLMLTTMAQAEFLAKTEPQHMCNKSGFNPMIDICQACRENME